MNDQTNPINSGGRVPTAEISKTNPSIANVANSNTLANFVTLEICSLDLPQNLLGTAGIANPHFYFITIRELLILLAIVIISKAKTAER